MKHASRHGFTLIEVLAVVAIAAMVVTVAAANLSAVAGGTALLSTKSGLAQLDARGRMHARVSGEPIEFEIDPQARRARLVGQRSHERLAEMSIPMAIGLKIELPRDKQRVVFDRRGISDDYALTLQDGSRSIRLTIAGLSGEVAEKEVEP